VKVAVEIAKTVRESSGGLVAVQAMGVRSEAGQAQVSMNLVDFTTTPLHVAFDAVRAAAAERGTDVAESEVVGLIPLDALTDAVRHYLKLKDFERAQILETRLME
jgi:glutamate formiminotransferase